VGLTGAPVAVAPLPQAASNMATITTRNKTLFFIYFSPYHFWQVLLCLIIVEESPAKSGGSLLFYWMSGK
jgi:hypothetical protein